MAETVMLNVRLPRDLKDHGTQVLQRNGTNVTEFVRSAFQYLEDEQRLPEYAQTSACSVYDQRRKNLRRIAGMLARAGTAEGPQEPVDAKALRHERLDQRYKDYLS
ncbi:MAG: hypothetical protein Q4E12_00895 [Coriobacteriia bacterium]|nr:hypothetical protein [Coriobacteriia bacterium]